MGAVLGQRKDKYFRPIHYASKTLSDAQTHYTTTEKELLAVVYAFEKFRSYLVLSKTIVVDIEIRDKKGALNLAADHLSRLENPHKGDLVEMEMNDNFPHESLNMIDLNADNEPPWFADIANYLVGNVLVKGMSSQQKKKQYVDGSEAMEILKCEVEAKALPINDARVVVKILKQLFSRFRTPRAIISDQGEHNAKWADKLDYTLWEFRTAFKTPIGCTPYRLVYGKACHLPIELEHKAYWALKWTNFDLKTAGDHRKVQLNELNELRDQTYENSLIYKKNTKKIHDSKIKNREFHVDDRVLLFNSRLKIFSGKLKSRWSGPFTITEVFPYGTIELSQPNGPNFKVNRHRIKHYHGGDVPAMDVLDLRLSPMDN
ncbi:reverse transcriptase domain-containing protein [Tanacetum coccineum]